MGGVNSGRWAGYVRKPLVEETPALDLAHPAVKEALEEPPPTLLRVEWTSKRDDQPATTCRVLLAELTPGRRKLWVVREDGRDPEAVELERAPMGFAPARWFARCPGCRGRIRVVYVLPDRVACRACGHLAYRSTRLHDKRVDEILNVPRTGDAGVLDRHEIAAARGGYARVARARLYEKVMRKLAGM
jgi:hypothetical protein